MQKTLSEKYGSLEAAYKEMNKKSRKTLLTKYGVDNAAKLPTHKEKCKNGVSKGKRCYNNGVENKMFYPGTEPKNFILGRLKVKKE